MSKFVPKFRKNYDDEEYSNNEYKHKKDSKKKNQKKAKYFDEFESFEAHHRFNTKSQKFRTY
jgi:hypothetical protein